MTEQHPITPPPELVQQWQSEPYVDDHVIATRAAQWGADQELEACCEVLHQHDRAYLLPSQLRAARRPSLKQQALAELAEWENVLDIAPDSPIRRALEALPE